MNFNIHSEILLVHSDRKVDISIIKKDQLFIYTTIPTINEIPIRFFPNEPTKLSYYFGEFVYRFSVIFHSECEINSCPSYCFSILGVQIEQNLRKEKRKNVFYPAAFFDVDTDLIELATILDISPNGAMIESKKEIVYKTIELKYEENGEKKMVFGEIMWSKKVGNTYHYGICFL